MLQKYRKALLACGVLILLLLGSAAVAQNRQIDRLNTRLSANYTKALYECTELMRGVEADLRKLTVSSSGVQLQRCLNQVVRQAQGAENAVAALPFSGEQIEQTAKAINQMGDFAATLSERIAGGGTVTQADAENINRLIRNAGAICQGLEEMIESGTAVEMMKFAIAPSADEGQEPASEYPALIYDGPFSDGMKNGRYKGITGEPVTTEEAQRRLTQYIGAERVSQIKCTAQRDLQVPAYEFSLMIGGMQGSAAVTVQGGHVLYILPETPVEGDGMDAAECIENAAAFLQRNGYGDMEACYSYRAQNVMTVNFVAVQDGVLLYPDMIKVQVAMNDGTVIGVECASYLKNHTERTLAAPQISRQEAISRLNEELDMQMIRKALIPVNTREALAYEVLARDSDENEYLIYIDAVNGQERQIYQLMKDENGTLTQ